MRIRGACLLPAVLLLPLTAHAADWRAKPATAEPQLCKETIELPPDIFGFSSGTDVATPGSLGLGVEYGGTFGTRSGSTTGSEGKVQLSSGLFPCVEIGPSITFGSERTKQAFGPETSETDAIGGAFEAKFKLFGRAQHGIGMTAVVEPSWSRTRERTKTLDEFDVLVSGKRRFNEFGLASKLLFDTVLIPERLFLAVNFVHDAAWPDVTPSENSSTFTTSAALTAKVLPNVYFGVEGSYRHAYNDAWFSKAQGDAWFVGPAFFWAISETVTLSGAWAIQVAGSEKTDPNEPYVAIGDLNLRDFNHHEAKLKLGISF